MANIKGLLHSTIMTLFAFWLLLHLPCTIPQNMNGDLSTIFKIPFLISFYLLAKWNEINIQNITALFLKVKVKVKLEKTRFLAGAKALEVLV